MAATTERPASGDLRPHGTCSPAWVLGRTGAVSIGSDASDPCRVFRPWQPTDHLLASWRSASWCSVSAALSHGFTRAKSASEGCALHPTLHARCHARCVRLSLRSHAIECAPPLPPRADDATSRPARHRKTRETRAMTVDTRQRSLHEPFLRCFVALSLF